MESIDSEELLRVFKIVEEQQQPIFFIYEPSTQQFKYLSPSIKQLWQNWKLPADTQPLSLVPMIHPDDRDFATEMYRSLTEGKEKKSLELRVVLPEQDPRWVCLTPQPVSLPDKYYVAGYAEDITVRKEYQDTLKRFAAKKNSILEILSHDLAGPLTSIQTMVGVLNRELKSYENGYVDKVMGLLEKTCARNIRLIREFVKQEFLESAAVEVVKQRVDLVVKTREVIEQYQESEEILAKTFNLIVPETPVYVYLDEVKFMQVINNLLSNAIKFTYDNGIINVTIEEREPTILITVADNGIGIPPHLQAGLFDKFTKARRPGIRGEESVGLGMSIIKTIVEWHQGRIWFESQENEGTTFYIEIPRE